VEEFNKEKEKRKKEKNLSECNGKAE